MQRAEEPPSRATTEPTRAPGLSPVKGFLLLGLILAVILGAVALTTGEPEQPATGEPGERTPSFALTDAEAIERFQELDELRISAYESRDPTLISRFLTADSPLRTKVENEILQLNRENVVPHTIFETKNLSVSVNESSEIVLRQIVIIDARFESESGRDVTVGQGPERQVIDWTLHQESSQWLIHDALILKSRPVAG